VHDDWAIRGGNDTYLKQVPRSVSSDQHEQLLIEIFDSNRIVVCVEDVLGADAVLVGTFGDDWIAYHLDKLPCIGLNCKLTCCQRRSPRTMTPVLGDLDGHPSRPEGAGFIHCDLRCFPATSRTAPGRRFAPFLARLRRP